MALREVRETSRRFLGCGFTIGVMPNATLMLLQGVHPKIVSERLGHSNIGITLDIHSHVLPSMQSEAARAFDDLFGESSEAPPQQIS